MQTVTTVLFILHYLHIYEDVAQHLPQYNVSIKHKI